MITVDARGKPCPLPMIQTKKAIESMAGEGEVEVLVDDETAAENLSKMAAQKGYALARAPMEAGGIRVTLRVSAKPPAEDAPARPPKRRVIVSVGADHMGDGEAALGRILLKGFLFAQTQLEVLPDAMVFYNGGAALTCEGSDALEDLRRLADAGVAVLTCGTCLNY